MAGKLEQKVWSVKVSRLQRRKEERRQITDLSLYREGREWKKLRRRCKHSNALLLSDLNVGRVKWSERTETGVCTIKWQTKNQSISCQPQSGKPGAPPGNMFKRPPDTPRLYIHPHTPAHQAAVNGPSAPFTPSFIHPQQPCLAFGDWTRPQFIFHRRPVETWWTSPRVCRVMFWGMRTKTEMMASIVRRFFLWDPGTKSRANQRGWCAHTQLMTTDNTAVTQLSLMLPKLAWRYGGDVNKRDRPLALLWFPLMDCLLYLMFFFCGPIDNNLFQSKTNR